jgi:hypothetical protein
MLSRSQSISLILLTACSIYIGFAWYWPHSNASLARLSPTRPSSAATNRKTTAHRSEASKSPDRDSPFATYNNPDYAVSFRYPRTFPLTEDADDFGGDSLLKTQQQLAEDQPGAVLLASIEIPDDAYPNTTFLSGHLQFAVNPTLSEPACRALASAPSPADPDLADPSSAVSGFAKADERRAVASTSAKAEAIHGLVFHWRQSRASANNITSLSRDYFAYSGDSCYEFFLQVTASAAVSAPAPAVADAAKADNLAPSASADDQSAVAVSAKGDVDSSLKPANEVKILRSLEKIVSTFQVRSKPSHTP